MEGYNVSASRHFHGALLSALVKQPAMKLQKPWADQCRQTLYHPEHSAGCVRAHPAITLRFHIVKERYCRRFSHFLLRCAGYLSHFLQQNLHYIVSVPLSSAHQGVPLAQSGNSFSAPCVRLLQHASGAPYLQSTTDHGCCWHILYAVKPCTALAQYCHSRTARQHPPIRAATCLPEVPYRMRGYLTQTAFRLMPPGRA